MSTDAQTQTIPQENDASSKSAAPEIKSLERVYSIPLINDTLNYAHDTLSKNTYTTGAYSTAQSLSLTAYRVSEPIQVRLAPLIVRADGIANKGLDLAESKFPYPFHVQTEELVGDIKTSTDHAYKTFDDNVRTPAYKAFDDRVKTPAYGLATKADASLTPIIDRLETVVHRITPQREGSDASSESSTDSQASTTQLSRAYRLSVGLKDQIILLSSEQVKQLQSQSVILQKATETIYKLNDSLASTYTSAKDRSVALGKDATTRVQTLSNQIIQELQRAQNELQTSTASLPASVQAQLAPLRQSLSQTVADVSAILRDSAIPASEKVTKIGSAVQERAGPLLEKTVKALKEAAFGSKKEETKEETNGSAEPTTNGNAPH
jgi:hypothetical protein